MEPPPKLPRNDTVTDPWLVDATKLLRTGIGNGAVELHAHQRQVLHHLLTERRNTLYIDKTGGGKSATYFLATKLLRQQSRCGPTIVVSPLLALMNDQLENAARFQLNAATINATTTNSERTRIFKCIARNQLDMLYVTAEMLSADTLYRNIPQLRHNYEEDSTEDKWAKIALLVIDEVHCISDWGHDFRAAYFSGLRKVITAPWAESALKLGASATVPKRVQNDLCKILGKWEVVRGDLYRSNISIRVIPDASTVDERKQWLLKWFKKVGGDKNVLIFAQSIREVEAFTTTLQQANILVAAYHSQLGEENRTRVEHQFKQGVVKVIVSTLALAMGFDKRDVHYVIHTYTPSSPVQYYQEIGRAGRGIDSAKAYILQTTPWRTDTARDQAMKRIFHVLKREKNPIELDDLYNRVADHNIQKKTANEAIILGSGRGYFREDGPSLRLLKEPTAEEEAETQQYIKERAAELKFMKNLFNMNPGVDDFCIWQKLLSFLGQQMDQKCNNCTRCKAKDGDVRVTKIESIWLQHTPTGKIPIYAFAVNDRDINLDVERVKQLLIEHEGLIAADPPSWMITYIPNSNDKNKLECRCLASALGLEMFEYLTPQPGSGSMRKAQTRQVREKVMSDKFTFRHEAIPPERNVLIYDDSAKSGMTLDVACRPLGNRKIIAIVNTLWTCEDLPPPKRINV